MRKLLIVLIVILALGAAVWKLKDMNLGGSPVVLNPNPRTPAERIVNGAKLEVLNGVGYDSRYYTMTYPNGDVPSDRGACTDVVVRSLRNAGFDLQKLIHEDMKANFSAYPNNWGLAKPDSNIDHRRVPNLKVFFKRYGLTLPTGTTGKDLETWKPGDIVCWKFSTGQDHTGIISDVNARSGLPLVIHNCGMTAQNDNLTRWKITGHFRYPVN